jgi:Integrase core domain
VLRRPVESAQYTSIRYTGRLDDLEAAPSVGSRGHAYDNAMAEAWVATFKTELVDGRRFPSYEHAELEILNWIGFYKRAEAPRGTRWLAARGVRTIEYQVRQHPNSGRHPKQPLRNPGRFNVNRGQLADGARFRWRVTCKQLMPTSFASTRRSAR